MAERVVEGIDQCIKKASELKKELQRLMNSIIDGDDYAIHDTNEAIGVLSSLIKLKARKYIGVQGGEVPLEFKCPLSGEIMSDPVVLASGQTYDRPYIQKWLNEGNRTCPQTQQSLTHTVLIPNILVREIISEWCEEHCVKVPQRIQEVDELVTELDRNNLDSLLEKMSSSLSEQKAAVKELRMLTKRMHSFRADIGKSDAIPILLNLLASDVANTDTCLQEDLITTLLNLSIHDDNKRIIAENPLAIPLLIENLKAGSIETRRNAAAALFTLSAIDSYKLLIGKSGAFKPLIDLLEEGNSLAMRDAAQAIFLLCIAYENKGIAVREGAVRVILRKISDDILVEELLTILALLSSQEKAVEEMGKLGAVSSLLGIIRKSNCLRIKEKCVAILHDICSKDPTKLDDIRLDETKNNTLGNMLIEDETPRSKRKASSILKRAAASSSSQSQRSASWNQP
ncbi:hypothetical protein ACOSP7_014601 [Xanthoceras sorbifolium]|uniref:RING-type E3 ubiquitin transferase n=1 Tax=Xanthoceras sorbifolium TaxID=99658 RepID=A0ABQ8I566_9ROSI|nr:hypothetical protein JRO89_XS04G0138300 [Xanthoceras sorbifolium]